MNNVPDNLEWTTFKGNSEHAEASGLRTSSKRVRQLTAEGAFVAEHVSPSAAARAVELKSSSGVLKAIKTSSIAGGHRWEYV
jgi:hypothetical protein